MNKVKVTKYSDNGTVVASAVVGSYDEAVAFLNNLDENGNPKVGKVELVTIPYDTEDRLAA